jgi:hypothetical protein
MFESERGWGSKIDGYAGPFETRGTAVDWADRYNAKYNNERSTPDYYIKAMDPVEYKAQKCDYRTDTV